MSKLGWIEFEGYEGRFDSGYAGNYAAGGFRFPFVERSRSWDIVRVDGEPSGGRYARTQFTVVSRGHDMMRKASDEFAAYRRHFQTCAGAGRCMDIGHPGGPRRSMREALDSTAPTSPAPMAADHPPVTAPASPRPPSAADSTAPWIGALGSAQPAIPRSLAEDLEVRSVQLRFSPWVGPHLSMSEDCNKRGGRLIGGRGDLSCAEVEIVKRFRQAGWQAAWIQAFRCGRRTWGDYISEPSDLPDHVQQIQRVAGVGGGHPDVVAWTADRAVFVESKGPGDSLKPSQVDWFRRAVAAGQPLEDIGLVEWTPQAGADA